MVITSSAREVIFVAKMSQCVKFEQREDAGTPLTGYWGFPLKSYPLVLSCGED
jgi:hypothetical protein